MVLANTGIIGYVKCKLLVAKPYPFSSKFTFLFFVGEYEHTPGIRYGDLPVLLLLVICFASGY